MYHASIRKLIVAFGSIFDEVHYEDEWGTEKRVPLNFSPKEKWLEKIESKKNADSLNYAVTLPRMGFMITDIAYSPERHLNPLSKIEDRRDVNTRKWMPNRVPYDFTFELYIATLKYETTLKLIETIVPIFTPELTVTIEDRKDFDLSNNITFNFDGSVNTILDFEGGFDSRRSILTTLTFRAQAYLYNDIRTLNRIRKTILNIGEMDTKKILETYIDLA